MHLSFENEMLALAKRAKDKTLQYRHKHNEAGHVTASHSCAHLLASEFVDFNLLFWL